MLELLGEGVKIAEAAAVAQWELKPFTSIPPVTAMHVGQVCFFKPIGPFLISLSSFLGHEQIT